MKEIRIVGKHLEVTPPTRPKKITGTRFATILGLNPWSSPFQAWCEITRTYEKPFVDSKQTLAGKVIEPKQIEYVKKSYAMNNLKTPEDVYGKDFFKKTYGDFFSKEPIFGGMWDSLLYENKKPSVVLEFKTTQRAEDWYRGIPEYYALQAALYAYLLGVDDVIMIASFLDESDYDKASEYVPSADNTITKVFKVSEKYKGFKSHIEKAEAFWKDYVLTGISPDFDEKKDADYLSEIRKTVVPEDDKKGIDEQIEYLEILKLDIDAIREVNGLDEKEKKVKELTETIKKFALDKFRDLDQKVEIKGKKLIFTVSKTSTSTIDKEALANDGLLDKYTTVSESYRLTTAKK